MRYVPMELESQARRAVNFNVGSIDKSGSVRGMQELYFGPKGGQGAIGRLPPV